LFFTSYLSLFLTQLINILYIFIKIKLRKIKKLFTLLISALFLSCNFDVDCPADAITCGPSAGIVNEQTFNAIPTNNYSISNVVLNGNCLTITISSSGCSADSWIMNLSSINAFYTVFPMQRVAKIELINNQDCAAVFQKTVTFDLTPFKIIGQNSVQITLSGRSQAISYQY